MYRKSENSNETKPLELEFNGNTVYVRKDFKFVESVESEERMMSIPAHWEYLELQMTRYEYEIYSLKQDIMAMSVLMEV